MASSSLRRLARFSAGGLLALGVLAAPLVADTARAADEPVTVTFIIYTPPGDPFWNPVIQGAEEAAKDRNVELDIQYADSDPVKQNNLIETAISNEVDGIALVNWIPNAFTDNIAKARDAGIAVVTFDTDDPDPTATRSQAYVGQDFFAAGQRIAQKMIDSGGLKAGDHVVAPVETRRSTAPSATRHQGRARCSRHHVEARRDRDDGDRADRISQYLVGRGDTKAVIGLGSVTTEVAPQAVARRGWKYPSAASTSARPSSTASSPARPWPPSIPVPTTRATCPSSCSPISCATACRRRASRSVARSSTRTMRPGQGVGRDLPLDQRLPGGVIRQATSATIRPTRADMPCSEDAAFTRRQTIRRWMREPITSIILFVLMQVVCIIGSLSSGRLPLPERHQHGALLMRSDPDPRHHLARRRPPDDQRRVRPVGRLRLRLPAT
jgi:simple sugar transport system substrate-binding protein